MKNIRDISAVSRLASVLNYEISTSILFALSFHYAILLIFVVIAALIFSPYLLFVLFSEKRIGWIISFIVIVIIPPIIPFLLRISAEYYSVLVLTSISLFYFYCFIIRVVINEWIKEYNWSMELESQKMKKSHDQQELDSEIDIRNIM